MPKKKVTRNAKRVKRDKKELSGYWKVLIVAALGYLAMYLVISAGGGK